MDPNEALKNLRQAYSDWEDNYGTDGANAIDAGERMRDAAEALDGWLSKGGFLPDAWAR